MALLSTDGAIYQAPVPTLVQANNIQQLSRPNNQDRVLQLQMYISLADGSYGSSTGGSVDQQSTQALIPYQVWS